MNLLPRLLGCLGRAPLLCALLAATLFGASCQKPPEPKYIAEFYLESPADTGIAFQMPTTHLPFHRMADPFLNQASVTRVEQGQLNVKVSDNLVRPANCLMFYFDQDGQKRLYMATAGNPTKRIFLFINSQPVAVRPIDQPIEDGMLFLFPEVADADLPAYVADLKESIKRFNDLKNSR